MEKVRAKYYVVLKGKKGYLKNKERDRWRSRFNFVVNPNKDKATKYTLKEMIKIKMLAKEKGISLKVIRRIDVNIVEKRAKEPRNLKERATRYRKETLRRIRNNMRDLVEYERKLVAAKKDLLKYTRRLESVNERLKPLMKHGEKGYSEPKPKTSN